MNFKIGNKENSFDLNRQKNARGEKIFVWPGAFAKIRAKSWY